MTMGMLYNLAGFAGMGCVLLAYAMANSGKWTAAQLRFHCVNLAGALLIIVSLMHDWNMPIFVLETAWACIAIYGIIKARRTRT